MARKKRSKKTRGKSPSDTKTAHQARDENRSGASSEVSVVPAHDGQSTDAKISAARRVILSVLIIGHLMAVVLPPMAFQAAGELGNTSVVSTLIRPVAAYAQFMYLDRGYAFFAPDPGPSHLVQAAVRQPSGEMVETVYPDRENQWPRLMYHRHFMLTEFLTEVYQSPDVPTELAEIDPQAAEDWRRMRARYEHVRKSMIDHLSSENGGKTVFVRRLEHAIPNHEEFQELNIPLDDPRYYNVLFDRPPPVVVPPPETIPPPPAAEELAEPDDGKSSEGDSSDDASESPDEEATDEKATTEADAGVEKEQEASEVAP